MKQLLIFAVLHLVVADVVHILEPSTPPPPPKPYAFGYAAGRFPGHIDRTHSEVSDGSGVVQGSYSYVDPKQKVRTVDYIADKNGFHVLNDARPKDTKAVETAKQRHLIQFANIANAHQTGIANIVVPVDSVAVSRAKDKHFTLFQKIAEEHARLAAEQDKLAAQATSQPILLEH